MRISIKCSAAVHMLLMIAALEGEQRVTSGFLAGSVGMNPVEIRKLLGGLKKAGIIHVARGAGGATLQKAPTDISLLDIYSAVDKASLDELIAVHAHPLDACPFGRNIHRVLSEPYAQIGDAVREKMAAITLAQLLQRLEALEPAIHAPAVSEEASS